MPRFQPSGPVVPRKQAGRAARTIALDDLADDTVPMRTIGRGTSDPNARDPKAPGPGPASDDFHSRETQSLDRRGLGLPARTTPAAENSGTTAEGDAADDADETAISTAPARAAASPAASPAAPRPGEVPKTKPPAATKSGPRAARHATGRRPPPRSSHRGAPARLLIVLMRVGTTIGECLITIGVLISLFLVYQLWWTNIQAGRDQHALAQQLNKQFSQQQAAAPQSGTASAPAPAAQQTAGTPFAYIWIPELAKLGHPYVFVVMQDVGVEDVLNKGAVGHYMQTAMPGQVGNFATAAHRNTHGEPFRYINDLQPGDQIVVETPQSYYIYTLDRELPQTSASDVAAIDPVPAQAGYTKPGQYITLTTCTPAFTSWYRLIWWGHLTQTIPWSPTRPAALAGLTRD